MADEQQKRGRKPRDGYARTGAERAKESRERREQDIRRGLLALYLRLTPDQQEKWRSKHPHAAKFVGVDEPAQDEGNSQPAELLAEEPTPTQTQTQPAELPTPKAPRGPGSKVTIAGHIYARAKDGSVTRDAQPLPVVIKRDGRMWRVVSAEWGLSSPQGSADAAMGFVAAQYDRRHQ